MHIGKDVLINMKRLFDIVISLTAILILSPMLLLLPLCIWLEDRSCPLYTQIRTGKDLHDFKLLKLRSMVSNADQIGSHSTASDDTRITKTGRFIRKTSLDELPQLFNVLQGNMSLVGPRPYLPKQSVEFTPEDWRKRHIVRPGITGLAQIRGRSNATQEERTKNDLAYVDHHNILTDMQIIFLTVMQVFGDRSGTN